jgi:hypothetical protein
MLLMQDEPLRYRLSLSALDSHSPAILLLVHEDVVKTLGYIKTQIPIVRTYQQDFGFKAFNGRFDQGAFGFGNGLSIGKPVNGIMPFAFPLVPAERLIDKPCPRCKGTGKIPFGTGMCIDCLGQKRERVYDPAELYAYGASLALLLHACATYCGELQTSSDSRQLLEVSTWCQPGAHGCSLHGVYSPVFTQWFSGKHRGQFGEVEQTTQAALRLVHPFHPTCPVSVDSSRSSLMIAFGADCCLFTDGSNLPLEGVKFGCKNVDTITQQIGFLAALAALSDQAVAERAVV